MIKEEVIQLLGILQNTYGKKFVDPMGTVEAWFASLAPYETKSIFKATRLYIETKTIKNFPNPADIIELITRAEIVYPDEETIPPNRLEAQRAVVTKLDSEVVDEYLDRFSEWIGLGEEQDEEALREFYKNHPEMRGILPYET